MKKDFLFSMGLVIALFTLFSCGGEKKNDAPVNQINGHEYVDLGLSVKWATCNVGATNPWEYGGYYAWGEIAEKKDYSWKTYKWCNGSYDTMTKYGTSSTYGIVDNKKVLDLKDDVANVKWGGSWRMPTIEEQKELLNSCSWEWTTLNGVQGYKVIGPNGNSIFLPAAGYFDGTIHASCGTYGLYWSSSLESSSGVGAYYFYFYAGFQKYFEHLRFHGRSVRPVCD